MISNPPSMNFAIDKVIGKSKRYIDRMTRGPTWFVKF